MVARTGGRLLDPSAAPTFAGTPTPAAVFPAGRILVRNLIALLSPGRLGLGPGRGLSVWLTRQLHDTKVIAERVAKPKVDAIRVLSRLLRDFHASGFQRLIGLAAVVCGEAQREAAGALADQLANLPGARLVHPGGAWLLEQH